MARVWATPLAQKGGADAHRIRSREYADPGHWGSQRCVLELFGEKFFSPYLVFGTSGTISSKINAGGIPDPWLLDCARAGIVLSRCSFRGLEPSYQVGAGPYTKVPEHSQRTFSTVVSTLFVWAHELWNLTDDVEPYFQHYLDQYMLPDGNFAYNTGVGGDRWKPRCMPAVSWRSRRVSYDYTHDVDSLRKRLPVLRRIKEYVLKRYRYSKEMFPPDDPRYGLIWGSPEADDGEPKDDYPEAHPYYYQNASWLWRGLQEHARCLDSPATSTMTPNCGAEAAVTTHLAAEMRARSNVLSIKLCWTVTRK